MKRNDIEKLLKYLGTKAQGGEAYVMASCPLAHWNHDNGTDTHPSFGVRVRNGGQSKYSCYACGEYGTLLELVYLLRMKNKKEPHGAIDFKSASELAEQDTSDQIPTFDPYEDASNVSATKMVVYPNDWLESFPKLHKHPYLHKRGILPWVAADLELHFDPAKKRICFPVRDKFSRLIGMLGRDITGESPLRYLAYDYKKKINKNVWLGEHTMDIDAPLILTEGPFDYASIYRIYPNVIASLGGLNYIKLKRIKDALNPITFFDYGTGGTTARNRIDAFFEGKQIKHICPTQAIGDAGNYSLELMEETMNNLFDKTLLKE